MTQMTEIKKLEAQVKCRKLVEGTDVKWNPPKPKTIMVELSIATAIFLCALGDGEIAKACNKALEELE